jgi:predicted amidophosphoribosyltransferase
MNDMICMKCGRDVALGQAFCKDCLEDMSHYPVNSTTPVQLPLHPPPVHTNRRTTRSRKAKKPEEQILRLKRHLRIQTIVSLILLTALIALGIYTFRRLYPAVQPPRPGENYITNDETSQNDLPIQ